MLFDESLVISKDSIKQLKRRKRKDEKEMFDFIDYNESDFTLEGFELELDSYDILDEGLELDGYDIFDEEFERASRIDSLIESSLLLK